MVIHRRDFLGFGSAALASTALASPLPEWCSVRSAFQDTRTYSVTPVVGDGKWIWNKPPADETGYLEPRSYDVEIGMELEGVGSTTPFMATTPAPTKHPEQEVETVGIDTSGCEAKLRQLTDGAAQLFVQGRLQKGQVARAAARYRVTLYKQYHGFRREQFAEKQTVPKVVRGSALQDSPGIQTRSPEVRQLAAQLAKDAQHPWDKAAAFAKWIPKNIRPQLGSYTSVLAALKNRVGDCEEMSAVFVALCRAVGIPARLVWVPNHNWAEFYLVDRAGQGHWIPAHTASYFWFGWTGAHELILQKGDRVDVPETRGSERLLRDWMRYVGRAPRVRYLGRLTPVPAEKGQDAGPGARQKDERGEWKVVGTHELDRYMRQ